MYSASVSVNVTTFVQTNGVISPDSSITATLSNLVPAAGTPPGVFTLSGNNITAQLPEGSSEQVVLTYNLVSDDYTLLGVAFLASGSSGHTGINQYPNYTVTREVGSSSLVLTDAALSADSGISFTYGIIIQQLSTSLVGIFDPRDETDN